MSRIGHIFLQGKRLTALLAAPVLLAACAGEDTGPILPERQPPDSAREVREMSTEELIALGDSFTEAGEPRAAIAVYDRAANRAPEDAVPLLRMGRLFLDAGDIDVAERLFRRALERRPDSAETRLALARIAVMRGTPDEALALLDSRRGAGQDPSREARNLRGVVLDLMGRHERAQLAYAEALAIDPDSAGAMINLALSLALSGEDAAARDILQELAETDDAERSRALENLALVHALAGRQQAALYAAMDAVDAGFASENAEFYGRLAALDDADRPRAVLLGRLPDAGFASDIEDVAIATSESAQPHAPPSDPAEQKIAAAPDIRTKSEAVSRASESARSAGGNSDAVESPAEYYLQLGSFRDAGRVQRHWQSLMESGLADELEGYAAPGPDPDGVMRLLAGPVEGYSASRARCAAIRDAGHACLIRVAPAGLERLPDGG